MLPMNPCDLARVSARLAAVATVLVGCSTMVWADGSAAVGRKPENRSDAGLRQMEPAGQPGQSLDGRDGRDLSLRLFRPKSMLRLPEHTPRRARLPAVDVHTHLRYKMQPDPDRLDEWVRLMDRQNIAVCVSLDGRLGSELDAHLYFLSAKHAGRFAVFANVDWRGDGQRDDPGTWDMHESDFAQRTVEALARAKQRGAVGLKVFKALGLHLRDADGSLARVDDARWDPIWEACGKLGMPVLIHTADPAAFFEPIDETNERWEELSRHPDWSFPPEKFPSRRELLEARNRVIARHPKTIFIGAHVANNPEDLRTVSGWLDRYPNLYVDIASRIGELGRQPYSARAFLIRHADRVLLGTDGPWPEARVTLYWRFLETRDENFPYSEKEFPPQGFWNIHGVGLPDDVLRKIYHDNAARVIPGVREKVEKYRQKTADGVEE